LPAAKARAAVVFLGEAGALDHRAHRPVQQQNSLREQLLQQHAAPNEKPVQLAQKRASAARLFSGICSAPAS
jgi:hypothetical protein